MKPVEVLIHIGKLPIFIPMNTSIKLILILLVIGLFPACTSTQISSALKTYNEMAGEEDKLSTDEVIAGLKEALIIGAQNSADLTSKTDGYFGNPEIRIPFPPEIDEVQTKLRQLGFNKLVDDFNLSINRAAERAASEAKPLFVNAIKTITVEDAWNILKGEENAATEYLRAKTAADLEQKFQPIIQAALESVNATKYYEDLTTTYNRIPLVTKVDTDLTGYVTDRALDGLFIMVAKEEAKIRQDPVARTTELLQRVFSQQ